VRNEPRRLPERRLDYRERRTPLEWPIGTELYLLGEDYLDKG
jgi:hypothetical protein